MMFIIIGYYLNPQNQYGISSSEEVIRETMEGVRRVIQRLEPNLNNQIMAINQVHK